MCRGLPLDATNGALVQLKNLKQQASARAQQWDDEFLQYTYKIVPCDKTWRHDYATCPFSHPGESSERRHPSGYLPFMCGSTQHSTDLKEKCPHGSACKYAHGHFELWLHPGRFRTKMCSLHGSCRRSVCFFAHSEAELRVTQYSKLDTAAAVAAQQLNQLAADGAVPSVATSLCGSVSARSNVASSVHSGSSDGGDAMAVFTNPCGSEAGVAVHGSPCAAARNGLSSAFTAGMVLNQQQTAGMMLNQQQTAGMMLNQQQTAGMMLNQQQPAVLEMQLQGNGKVPLLAADAVNAAASTAPAMWLGGSMGMLQQMPIGTMAYGRVLPQQQQQQLVYLDVANHAMGFTQGAATTMPAAAGTDMMNGWMLAPNAAAPPMAVNGSQDQWVATNMLAAAQHRNAAYGLAGTAAGFSCPPAAVQVQSALPMPNMLGSNGLDQWLQVDNAGLYCGTSGFVRPAMGCGIGVGSMQHQHQSGAANARMAQLLSTLPQQTVQQLLAGVLAVDAPGA